MYVERWNDTIDKGNTNLILDGICRPLVYVGIILLGLIYKEENK